MKKELTCIICPNSCEMTIEIVKGNVKVEGALCKRGRIYAEQETTNPVRVIATSVPVENGELPLVSVRLNKPIPKKQIFQLMKAVKKIKLEAPVYIGDIVMENVLEYGGDLIATKNINRINGV